MFSESILFVDFEIECSKKFWLQENKKNKEKIIKIFFIKEFFE
jgi:hypothetical protein